MIITQFYENINESDTIAIIFEGTELELGFRVMEDLLKAMKMAGGSESEDMQQWLRTTKAKFIPASNVVN